MGLRKIGRYIVNFTMVLTVLLIIGFMVVVTVSSIIEVKMVVETEEKVKIERIQATTSDGEPGYLVSYYRNGLYKTKYITEKETTFKTEKGAETAIFREMVPKNLFFSVYRNVFDVQENEIRVDETKIGN